MLKRFKIRTSTGSIMADYAAAIVVFILFITFPLIDLATIGFRYSLMVAAARECAHAAAVADTFSSASSANNAIDNVNNVFNKWKNADAGGITAPTVKTRINSTDITNKIVTRGAWGAKLSVLPPAGTICTIECVIDGNVNPIAMMQGGPIKIPGVTAPVYFQTSSQELAETPTGLNQ